jgi:hypothetical protein
VSPQGPAEQRGAAESGQESSAQGDGQSLESWAQALGRKIAADQNGVEDEYGEGRTQDVGDDALPRAHRPHHPAGPHLP